MTKKSIIERDKKRFILFKKYNDKRIILKKIIKNVNIPMKERLIYVFKLQSLPRDSSLSRYRNRCILTGRPRSYLKKFGLSRIKFRELAMNGEIPGLIKSSW